MCDRRGSGDAETQPVPHDSSDDDWEALADREPCTLLSVEELPQMSKLSVEERKEEGPKRRGRGNFTYKKDVMYTKYGTRHVLVLAGFSPSLRTSDLVKLFVVSSKTVDFSFVGSMIQQPLQSSKPLLLRLAIVFNVRSFTIRVLDDHDSLLGSISGKDLEPPTQRPKTSARTAQRLIAHSMGLKLPASGFGSKELRDQEAARKNRIVSRQKQRDDAWGAD
ncbi:hypothetical protein DY000_02018250 [Brassica cretica]|uniref:Ribosome biogenesis protein RPF2 homolog n=1 Tax=Brassica cretica TaxID=69181 RepID=A0ABQ7CLG1_BRACR|nr:hypothetical protein DY000_02018250 [Brassica cretica]